MYSKVTDVLDMCNRLADQTCVSDNDIEMAWMMAKAQTEGLARRYVETRLEAIKALRALDILRYERLADVCTGLLSYEFTGSSDYSTSLEGIFPH